MGGQVLLTYLVWVAQAPTPSDWSVYGPLGLIAGAGMTGIFLAWRLAEQRANRLETVLLEKVIPALHANGAAMEKMVDYLRREQNGRSRG